MVPLVDFSPIENLEIPIYLAAIGPRICETASEGDDGKSPHPVSSPKFICDIMLPAAAKGIARFERSMDYFAVPMKPMVATAADVETLAERVRDACARIALYASTPAYSRAFDIHGLTDLTVDLAQLSQAQHWKDMPDRIFDEVLHTYVTNATYDEISTKLTERHGDVVTGVEFSILARMEAERECFDERDTA